MLNKSNLYTIFALGPSGSHCEEAVKLAPDILGLEAGEYAICLCNSIMQVENNTYSKNSIGVLPNSNSTSGTIAKYFVNNPSRVKKLGTVELPVRHHLLANRNISQIRDIKLVVSHGQGFLQCDKLLKVLGITPEMCKEVDSASVAAKLAAKSTLKEGVAAIASEKYGREHGLTILIPSIHDQPDITTQFSIYGPPDFQKKIPILVPKVCVGIIEQNGHPA